MEDGEMIEKKILRMLADANTPLRSRELAERLGVSKPTVISHLNRLKDEGKVEQVLYRNVLSWQSSREWSTVLQRAKRLEQRLKAMYGEDRFDLAEARERLKDEFNPREFDNLLELVPDLKPPEITLQRTRRIGCTPEEERRAETKSRYSQLAAEFFNRVEVLLETFNVPSEALILLPAPPPDPPLPRFLFNKTRN